MYELADKEHAAVLKLNAEYRQSHFRDKVRQQQGLYILLGENGPFLLEDCPDDGAPAERAQGKEHQAAKESVTQEKVRVLPVWCHERYAGDYLELAGLKGLKEQFVTARAWNEHWVALLQREGVLEGFMPLEQDGEFVVAAAETIEEPQANQNRS